MLFVLALSLLACAALGQKHEPSVLDCPHRLFAGVGPTTNATLEICSNFSRIRFVYSKFMLSLRRIFLVSTGCPDDRRPASAQLFAPIQSYFSPEVLIHVQDSICVIFSTTEAHFEILCVQLRARKGKPSQDELPPSKLQDDPKHAFSTLEPWVKTADCTGCLPHSGVYGSRVVFNQAMHVLYFIGGVRRERPADISPKRSPPMTQPHSALSAAQLQCKHAQSGQKLELEDCAVGVTGAAWYFHPLPALQEEAPQDLESLRRSDDAEYTTHTDQATTTSPRLNGNSPNALSRVGHRVMWLADLLLLAKPGSTDNNQTSRDGPFKDNTGSGVGDRTEQSVLTCSIPGQPPSSLASGIPLVIMGGIRATPACVQGWEEAYRDLYENEESVSDPAKSSLPVVPESCQVAVVQVVCIATSFRSTFEGTTTGVRSTDDETFDGSKKMRMRWWPLNDVDKIESMDKNARHGCVSPPVAGLGSYPVSIQQGLLREGNSVGEAQGSDSPKGVRIPCAGTPHRPHLGPRQGHRPRQLHGHRPRQLVAADVGWMVWVCGSHDTRHDRVTSDQLTRSAIRGLGGLSSVGVKVCFIARTRQQRVGSVGYSRPAVSSEPRSRDHVRKTKRRLEWNSGGT